jgi:sucrose-6-phosphate hydrolase SacC (GH32 family)
MKKLLCTAFFASLSLAAWAAAPSAPATPSATAPAPRGGFLFTTFKGEQTPKTEQIYFALSADGLHWDALNKGDPVLVSEVGEKGVRDPYLLRSHDNKKFILLATDLSINLNSNWSRAQNAGSRSIVIWESEDLVKWSEPRLVKVAPDDAGCTWAPEAIYDEDTKDYLVYWASKTQRDNFAKHRIWSARTTDFKTFSKPEVYIEKSNTVIDTDIIRDPQSRKYYRFTKDERTKAISMESADKIAGPWADVAGFSLAAMTGYEGPAAFQLKPPADGQPATWCLLLDFYSRNQGYKPFTTTDLASGKFTANNDITFPFRFRHGSILALTPEELARVKAAYAK